MFLLHHTGHCSHTTNPCHRLSHRHCRRNLRHTNRKLLTETCRSMYKLRRLYIFRCCCKYCCAGIPFRMQLQRDLPHKTVPRSLVHRIQESTGNPLRHRSDRDRSTLHSSCNLPRIFRHIQHCMIRSSLRQKILCRYTSHLRHKYHYRCKFHLNRKSFHNRDRTKKFRSDHNWAPQSYLDICTSRLLYMSLCRGTLHYRCSLHCIDLHINLCRTNRPSSLCLRSRRHIHSFRLQNSGHFPRKSRSARILIRMSLHGDLEDIRCSLDRRTRCHNDTRHSLCTFPETYTSARFHRKCRIFGQKTLECIRCKKDPSTGHHTRTIR